MKVLLDNGVPRGVAPALQAHIVEEARNRNWDRLKNGELLDSAATAGFDVLLTTDRGIRHQQNLTNRKIGIVVLSRASWPLIKQHLSRITNAVDSVTPGSVIEVEIPKD